MALVTLTIGGQAHQIACRDGGEPRLVEAARLVDQRWAAASRGAGGAGNARVALIAALMLADALLDAQAAPASPPATVPDDSALASLADRLERLADALEDGGASA